MESKFRSGPFKSDSYIMDYVEPLIERGYLPPLPEELSMSKVRHLLASNEFMNRSVGKNTARIPQEWDEDTVYFLGHINDEGLVWKVDITNRYRDGTKAIFEAVAEREKSQDEFYKANPHLQGERAYVAWLSHESDM